MSKLLKYTEILKSNKFVTFYRKLIISYVLGRCPDLSSQICESFVKIKTLQTLMDVNYK